MCGDPRRLAPPVQLAAGRRPPGRLAPHHQDPHRRLLQPHQHIIPHRGPRRHLHLLSGQRGRLSEALSSTAGELISHNSQSKCGNIDDQVNVPPRWVERPANSSGVPGDRLEIRCGTSGRPNPEVNLRIDYLVGNPEEGLPSSIITL